MWPGLDLVSGRGPDHPSREGASGERGRPDGPAHAVPKSLSRILLVEKRQCKPPSCSHLWGRQSQVPGLDSRGEGQARGALSARKPGLKGAHTCRRTIQIKKCPCVTADVHTQTSTCIHTPTPTTTPTPTHLPHPQHTHGSTSSANKISNE